MNISEGDESWREHLMGSDGCVKNPRRIQALKKSKTIDIMRWSKMIIETKTSALSTGIISQQGKAVVVPSSQVNSIRKPNTTSQKKVPASVK
jgi:hypothetical protein